MIKRTIEVSSAPAHLTAKLEQLLIQRPAKGDMPLLGEAPEGPFRQQGSVPGSRWETVASIPCEDIGVVVVDEPQTTYSQSALAALARYDAVLIVCGRDHLPAAMLLPLADHHQVVWRVAEQAAVRRPVRKQLWRQLVRAKIRAQAHNLAADAPARKKLLELARLVRSGDPANVEAHAAKIYWRHWLDDKAEGGRRKAEEQVARGQGQVARQDTGKTSGTLPASHQPPAPPSKPPSNPAPFRRDANGDGLNAFLNYGYAIVRAAVARALVAAGLLPALGLHHANRSNAFCLADDLLEPLRPLVDRRARALWRMGYRALNPDVKRGLLDVLAERVRLGQDRGPLMVQLHRMAASLVHCYQGETDRLEIPHPCSLADTDVCGF